MSKTSIGLDLHWNLWPINDKNVFLVDNAQITVVQSKYHKVLLQQGTSIKVPNGT